ncbi:MAG TPA: Rid family hydrolase [Solirubrobacteraceae bacterium]|nr:Rid family hydrolase [Solirubrobacteraceae bacterium]
MTVERHRGDPPSPYELNYGFSRIVRAGDLVMIGGTTSIDELGFVVGITPYEQALEVLRKLVAEFGRVGVEVSDVVSARAYVTDMTRAAEVARAFSDVFVSVRPLFTLVGVAALIDPRMLVEIEATAYTPSAPGS